MIDHTKMCSLFNDKIVCGLKRTFFVFLLLENVVCQNVRKEQMDILQQWPVFESQLAEVGDIANVSKRLSFLS